MRDESYPGADYHAKPIKPSFSLEKLAIYDGPKVGELVEVEMIQIGDQRSIVSAANKLEYSKEYAAFKDKPRAMLPTGDEKAPLDIKDSDELLLRLKNESLDKEPTGDEKAPE